MSSKWRQILLDVVLIALFLENLYLLYPSILRALPQPFKHERTRMLRGVEIAQTKGCFSCHGPMGTGGVANPGSDSGEVPSLDGGTIRMYVQSEEEIAEYIQEGMPRRKRQDPKYMAKYRLQLIKMPAFDRHLTPRQVSDLISFIQANNGLPESKDPEVVEGENLTLKYHCTACHGPRGGGGIRNPASFKGYVPGWLGGDYRDLVKNEKELLSWIERGKIERFERNPLARFFTERQVIQMPAYKGHLTDLEIRRIARYLMWLNRANLG